jgi:DNA-binding NtrC family response regulator
MTRRYLLVDDNRAFAENVAEILTDAGAEVVCASDATAALDAIGASQFDALVTDMKMPGVSGCELLRRVRARDPGLPVVLVSAYTHNEQLAEAWRLGLLAFIAKTSGPAELVTMLTNARRDAMVASATDDEAYLEHLRERLSKRGITVCAAHAEGLTAPLAILSDGDAAAVAQLRSRFPATPVVSAGELEGVSP